MPGGKIEHDAKPERDRKPDQQPPGRGLFGRPDLQPVAYTIGEDGKAGQQQRSLGPATDRSQDPCATARFCAIPHPGPTT
jgi:hypothetical protein